MSGLRRSLLALTLAALSSAPAISPVGGQGSPLEITSPVAGSIALAGMPLTIRWTTSPEVPESASLRLMYSADGGSWNEIACFPILSAYGTPSYEWEVPSELVGSSITIRGILVSSCGGGFVSSFGADEVGSIRVVEGVVVVALMREGLLDLVGVSVPGGETADLYTADRVQGLSAKTPSVSPDGRYVAFIRGRARGGSVEDNEVFVLCLRSGSAYQITLDRVWQDDPAVSPGGDAVAYVEADESGRLHRLVVQPLSSGRPRKGGLGGTGTVIFSLPPDSPEEVRDPAFSPDGSRLAFAVGEPGSYSIYTYDLLRGKGPAELFDASGVGLSLRSPSWSPDGSWIAVSTCPREPRPSPGEGCRLGILASDGSRLLLVNSDAPEVDPSWSPDGRYLAYVRRGAEAPDVGYMTELWLADVGGALEGRGWKGQGNVVGVRAEKRLLRTMQNSFISSAERPSPSWAWYSSPVILDLRIQGTVGERLTHDLSAVGGSPPLTWSLAPGSSLPRGLSLSPSGRIEGTPEEPAVRWEFTVTVTDSAGISSSKALTLTIWPEEELSLSPGWGAFFMVGPATNRSAAEIEISGGAPPYDVEVTELSGDFEWSLVNDSGRLVVEVRPTSSAAARPDPALTSFYVRVTDSMGEAASGRYAASKVSAELRNVWGPISDDEFSSYEICMRFGGYVGDGLEGIENRLRVYVLTPGGRREITPLRTSVFNEPGPWGSSVCLEIPQPDADLFHWSPTEEAKLVTLVATVPASDWRPDPTEVWLEVPIPRSLFGLTHGHRFVNGDMGELSWHEWCEFYGAGDACMLGDFDSCPCGLTGISYLDRDPVSYLFYWLLRRKADLEHKGGCFGMAFSGIEMAEGRYNFLSDSHVYNSAGGRHFLNEPEEIARGFRVMCRPYSEWWDDRGRGRCVSDVVKRDHLWQFSMEALRYTIHEAVHEYSLGGLIWGPDMASTAVSAAHMYKTGDLSRPPILGILLPDGWHAVSAYEVEDLPNGTSLVRIYDPNKPMHFDPSDPASMFTSDGSFIYVYPDGTWRYAYASGPRWARGETSWGSLSMVVIPTGDLVGDPNGVSVGDLPELLISTAVEFVFGSADVEQIADSEGRTFFNPDGSVNWDPATKIPGSATLWGFDAGPENLPVFFLPNGTFETRVVGTGPGWYGFGVLTRDGAYSGLDYVGTSEGEEDSVSLDSVGGSLGFSPGGEKFVRYSLRWADRERGEARVIAVGLPGLGSEVDFSWGENASHLDLRFGGPAEYDLALFSAAGGGTASTFRSDGIGASAGEVHRIVPDWSDPSEVRILIDRDGDGSWDDEISPDGRELAPVADAGPDVYVVADSSGRASVQLDGSGSRSPSGKELSYEWIGDSGDVLTGPTPTVELPIGVWLFELRVSDGERVSEPDAVVVRVAPPAGFEGAGEDSDGDGVPDVAEVGIFGTDPNSADTDGDGIPDGRDVSPLGQVGGGGGQAGGKPPETGPSPWGGLIGALPRPWVAALAAAALALSIAILLVAGRLRRRRGA